jgi:two-component system sensor histidine kinase/response regulator
MFGTTKELSLNFTITPPWWATTFFRGVVLILVILSIIGIIKLRVRRIKRRQIILEKLVEERTADLLKSKEQLQKAVDAKDKLFSIVAHDLKNPFLPLLGYSEMLAYQIKNLDAEDVESSAKLINQSARSIYTLLENLLDWARIQLNKFDFIPSHIELYDMVQEVYDIYRVVTDYKQISLINHVDKNMRVFADVDMLKTILRNVVSNSVKYCNEGDKISIQAHYSEDKIKINITDTGVGMDKEKVDKLNNDTNQMVKEASTDKESGTGLGLVLVKDLLDIMSGTLTIRSQINKGTEIIIMLPINKVA